jgi:WD40 repeat protein
MSRTDKSVKFWKISDLSDDSPTTDLKFGQSTPAFITFVSLQVKEGIAISGDMDGVIKTWDILSGVCKESYQIPVPIHCGDAQLIDGRLLVILVKDYKVCIYDAESSQIFQELEINYCWALRISGDGSKLFAMDWDDKFKMKTWSTLTWELGNEVEIEQGYGFDPFYASSSKVWVQHICSKNPVIKGWDFGIPGSSPIPLPNTSSERPNLELTEGEYGSNGPTFIKDSVTGREIFRLSGKHKNPRCMRWDGQYLIFGYNNGEVLILDFKNLSSQ